MEQNPRNFLRKYAPMIYGPTALFSLGEGTVLPVIPLIATEFGASVAEAALVTAALIVGKVIGNLPAGWVIARFGERITMALSGFLAFVGVAVIGLSNSLPLLSVMVFWIGMCAASFSIARHAFMTTRVPLQFRARSLSLLGGAHKFGIFVGPFAGSAAIAVTGQMRSVFWWFGLCLIAAVLLVWFGPDPERAMENRAARAPLQTAPIGIVRTVGQHRSVLLRVGLSAASMSAVRQARNIVLPLWGASIGLPTPTILIIVGASGAIDFALFYLSGQVMDKHGRLWVALPSMIIMGLGFAILAFTHELNSAHTWFVICAILAGIGNGLSSGALMTIGADLAPKKHPAPFLGAWHFITDGGSASTPVIFSALVAVSSISVATLAIGIIASLGAAGFARWLPRYQSRR